MSNTYPLLELVDARTKEPVSLFIWHIRAIYQAVAVGELVTRVEFTNGDLFDSADRIEYVLTRVHELVPRVNRWQVLTSRRARRSSEVI